MKVAIGTVVYNGISDKILDDYIFSINKQVYTDFDVLILNDGLETNKLNYLKEHIERKKYIRNARQANQIHLNRVDLLKLAKKENYNLVIMADVDDIMSKNRVKEYINQYEQEYPFFYNDLSLFNGDSVFDKLPERVFLEDILEENFIGLSNSGINLDRIDLEFIDSLAEGDSYVFDWYLYSRILLKENVGKKISNATTYYRIYDGNIAGICKQDKEALLKEISIKIKQYTLLEKYSDVYKKLLNIYSNIELNNKMKISKSKCWWGNLKFLK